jgi:hypothetical protein
VILDVSWRMLAAASCLILLPGIALVRAPWPTVPAFSIAFWVLSWGLVSATGSGRLRFVGASLLVFLVLGALRALQPRLWSAPTAPALLGLATAILALVPWLAVPVPAAPDLSFDSAVARLLVWRDGIPASFEPLVPGQRFVTDALGFQLVAADVSGLGAMPPHRAAFLVHRVGTGLLLLSLVYALARLFAIDTGSAVVGTLLPMLLLEVAHAHLPLDGSTDLQAAFLVLAGSLLLHRTSRSATVAGCFFAAAAVAVAPTVRHGFVAALVASVVLGAARSGSGLVKKMGPAWLPVLATTGVVGFAGAAAYVPRPAFTPRLPEAAAWVEAHVSPLEMICNDDGGEARWLPAVAGRAVSHPPQPRSGGPALVPSGRTCRLSYADVLGFLPPP